VQKFCESIGELSDRSNIICISDEAHRTQTNTGAKFDAETGETKIGFAAALRKSFPNATYCGFTGTPIDETLAVFGDIVDAYAMKESVEDEITVNITYEPRLARVIVSDEQAKEINRYYEQCLIEGANEAQVEESKKAMSAMKKVLGDPDRLQKLAKDMVAHYEALCGTKPLIPQKAMIVCADRTMAFALYKQIAKLRPDWLTKRKSEDESSLTKEQLGRLEKTAKLNLVATRGQDDPKELYDYLGTKEYRSKLAKLFKDKNSNFKIDIVVDMWITGFDVPELSVMYIDKPLQKHTLIQTISRVNRKAEGKDQGLVVDYIGIREDMLLALKRYGALGGGNAVNELNIALSTFRNHLQLLAELMHQFDTTKFFIGTPLERLQCLNQAAEFVQIKKETEIRFMGLSRRLKSAYEICLPSGELA
jgi:type I restriction enzyme R subunit